MTFVIVMGFHQIIVVMNDVKWHTLLHTYMEYIRIGLSNFNAKVNFIKKNNNSLQLSGSD